MIDYDIDFELPKKYKTELLSCFAIQESFIYPEFHPVWDKDTNEFLSKKIGIVTDCPIYNLNNCFRLFFDWKLQIWYVG